MILLINIYSGRMIDYCPPPAVIGRRAILEDLFHYFNKIIARQFPKQRLLLCFARTGEERGTIIATSSGDGDAQVSTRRLFLAWCRYMPTTR